MLAKNKSMTDAAYEVMCKRKRAIPFKNLWFEVLKKLELEPEEAADRLAQFYTDMTLDSRFTSLKENKWDLRERRKFEEVYVELKDLDDEEDDEFNDYESHDDEEGENIHKIDEEGY